MTKLYLAGKGFKGEVRAVLAALAAAVGPTLEVLHLGSNRLTAPLPGPPRGSAAAEDEEANVAAFGLTVLRYLYLDSNDIEAPFSDAAGGALMSASSPPLMVLSMHQNRLTGPIPPHVGQLTNLEWLNLGWNRLSGSVPSEILELKNLKYLWLSANQLSGEIPGSGAGVLREALPRLSDLRVAGNERLRGCLPLSLCRSSPQRQTKLVIEADYTQLTDCSCPEDEPAIYPPYPPMTPSPPASPSSPLIPAPPPPATYVYVVRGNATLDGYSRDDFGATEQASFASGIAATIGLKPRDVLVVGVRSATVRMNNDVPARRLLGGDDNGREMVTATVVDFEVTVGDKNRAEEVIAVMEAANQPRTDGASLLMNALLLAGLRNLVGLRLIVEPAVEARRVYFPPPPPPQTVVTPEEVRIFPAFPGLLFPVSAWPWIWALSDGRWFTLVQILTTLGTF